MTDNKEDRYPPATNLEDVSLIAYLVLRGHIAIPWRDVEDKGHICFQIESDITKDMDAYYANEKVGIQDYVKVFKAIKSQMYNLKSMERKE